MLQKPLSLISNMYSFCSNKDKKSSAVGFLPEADEYLRIYDETIVE